MPFLYLLLAHITADFLLQPNKLVKWKYKSNTAILIHVFTHFIVMMLALFPYWMNPAVLIASFFISFIHYFIDIGKIYLEKKMKHIVEFFLIDQLIHIATLLLASAFLVNIPIIKTTSKIISLYLNPAVIIGIIMLIIATRVCSIFNYQLKRAKNPKAKFNPDKKITIRNLIIFSIIYAIIIIFGVFNIAFSLI